MSLEACAGKNVVGHVGKTYHAVAWDAAAALLGAGAGEATVRLLSRIGNPVTMPEAVHIETTEPVDGGVVEKIVAECLDDWSGVADRFLEGAYPVV
jgi:S-adenosylmethionine synthetase